MARYFSWPHDFWRRMGWREFRAWAAAMNRQLEPTTDPGSWQGVEADPNWQALHAERDRMLGR